MKIYGNGPFTPMLTNVKRDKEKRISVCINTSLTTRETKYYTDRNEVGCINVFIVNFQKLLDIKLNITSVCVDNSRIIYPTVIITSAKICPLLKAALNTTSVVTGKSYGISSNAY